MLEPTETTKVDVWSIDACLVYNTDNQYVQTDLVSSLY